VDKGANIPLDQILVGPRPVPLEFEEQDEVRGISKMLADAAELPDGARRAAKAGQKSGWGPLARGAFVAYRTKAQGEMSKKLSVG
jgi:hypothetical protein